MTGQWIQKPQQDTTVIFVHGILSSAEKCWKNSNSAYWPELLKQDKELNGLGIYTFSYNTSVFSGNYCLSDVVDSLKEYLKLDDLLSQEKRLIFVCHSMGGIVVRKFIVDRQAYLIDLNIKIGLFLVASPSLGSEYANLITGLAKILNIKNAQADALRFNQNNTWLNDLDTNFQNLKEAKRLAIIGKELIEDKPIILKNFLKKQIVEPFSGAKYFGDHFKVPKSDHSTIEKPHNSDAIQHRLLCRFIKEAISSNEDNVIEKKLAINKIPKKEYSEKSKEVIDFVDRYLSKNLDDSLSSFSSQPIIWVDPILSKSSEVDRDAETADKISLSELVLNPKSTIIKAPPQFGLTSLAHNLIREAWRNKDSSLWLYLDASILKPHFNVIEKAANTELKLINFKLEDVKCVVLDSWLSHEEAGLKLLEKVSDFFKDIPLIVMQTIDDTKFLNQSDGASINRNFDVLYLWSLSRGHIRKIVADYNNTRVIGSEDVVIKRIVSDLEVLNLHRTPLNCLTLLKVSEIDFDESPVNRTEMIRRVLFLLFNVDDIPTYKVRPDLKDCEYVLGYFCETILRENNYIFSMQHFLKTLNKCCQERLIDLEVQIVFDVLFSNNILIKCENGFRFKFSYWIYYFIAQRMHHNLDFSNFILEDMRYAKFPEVIEFYTGIDRRRDDALKTLIKDIRESSDRVQARCGLPDGLNPYRFAKWQASPKMLEQMQNEISDGVQESNLPESIKDSYADSQYDRTQAYNQDVRDILAEHSLIFMMRTMKAGARALRNSDYVEPDIKRQLLQEIMRCWEQISKVLMVLIPLLATEGQASFDGAGFLLCGNFGDNPLEKMQRILLSIPNNIVFLSQDDIFSQKMGPLLINQLINEEDEQKRHILALLLIHQRPRDWKKQIEQYIVSIASDSFYLMDIYLTLRVQYSYSYASSQTLKDIEYLIKFSAAKHKSGRDLPGEKQIRRVSKDVIPPRKVEQDI
jgi:hypothetical protein